MQLLIVTHVKKTFATTLAVALIATALIAPAPVQAQGLFSPAITINDSAVTLYELNQRELFLRLLRAPGDPVEMARTALIEDRLKQQALKEAGIEVAPEDVEAAIEEFAGRSNLGLDEFVEALNQGGVSRETLRDFVKINVEWSEYIRARYLAQARPTETEIDRALGRAGSGGVQVLLSEIIIPITPQTLAQVESLADQISNTTGPDAFASAAIQYSASDTRNDGGKMGWVSLNQLPAGLRPVILALSPGQNSTPIALPNAVAVFQMRGLRETSVPAQRYASVDYATYFIPGGRSPEARAVARSLVDRIDTCDDLYGIAKDQPAEVLERFSKKPGEIPRDIALELAKLDVDEISTNLTTKSGQSLILLMLCGRTNAVAEDATREEVAQALTQQRLELLSASLLDQLEAEALINGR
jgi:peptidyl-prolyl cis-trans isomerase SurA